MSLQHPNSIAKLRSKILFGENESIFSKLPNSVLANLRYRASENALLWNLIYPLAQPLIFMKLLLRISPLWGTPNIELEEDWLKPYFWGWDVAGERLSGLDDVLERIDGSGLKTEIDLFLVGNHHLVVVEAKHLSGLGRCSRYANHRCPEIHREEMEGAEPCRYWETGQQEFQRLLNFGHRPRPGDSSPPCNRHYQLARTLVVGDIIAREQQLGFSLWMMVSKAKWRSFERTWLDFVERIRSDELWRRMRVIAWEDMVQFDLKENVA